MKENVTMRHAAAMHLRAVRELHQVTPSFFPVLTLYCIFDAVLPYVTVFFSARILTELAVLRRAEILWQWVFAGVVCTGLGAIAKAMLFRRYHSLLNDLYGRKEILFIHKMFELDYAELDKQENHDLREQIRQNENWASWGLMRTERVYSGAVTSVLGLLGGMTLTVSLFLSPVPEDAEWLTVLNHPLFVVILAAGILVISILAGRLSAASMKCWSDFAEEATFGNRLFSHFGFVGKDAKRSMDIRMNDQQRLILLNGIDIHKYKYDDYRNIFSVVFQDFQLICQPLGNNVAGSMKYDRERAKKALVDAGFGDRLASMKKGLDTMLYKNLSEDGVEVSGGEAQKIAIARALYKDAPFIILDEPTAALDPIAEAEIYEKFDKIAGDKTAVYISHRLSSCKFCDEIAVFQDGAVIQQGTHDELIADTKGKYYELWNAQAQYYTE